ncbi:hypothetical protein K438DRAFT_1959320 [Mycena galopus ATCC 62051]|nr:hypothetical protein K438DRAFT_1959320 [Mycena galopus ATCC 62051]
MDFFVPLTRPQNREIPGAFWARPRNTSLRLPAHACVPSSWFLPPTMIVPATQVSTKTFDYIVIGEWRGLTLATRLSETSSLSVLVLEAGPANLDDPEILNPAYFRTGSETPNTTGHSKRSHKKIAKTDPCLSTGYSGKGLGGSSALNFFQYHRPARSDIDAFEELGNSGWNWELLEPYYAKSERFIQPVENGIMGAYFPNHGLDGPLTVAYPSAMSSFELPFKWSAMKNLGIDLVTDPFAGNTKGAWFTPMTIDPAERVRSYSANKYYQPNAMRKNLSVVVGAHVTKIVTEQDQHGYATAVEVEFVSEEPITQSKLVERLFCLQEPSCLRSQNSGLGMFGMAPTCITFVPLAAISPEHSTLQASLAKSINEGIASQRISPPLAKQYEIQLRHQQDREPSCEFMVWPLFRPVPDMPMPGTQYLAVAGLLNHPLSRGSIHIASSDPLIPPEIDPNYFEHEYDLLQLVEQIKFCRKIADQEPLKRLLTGNELTPGLDVQTDEQIAEFVKSGLSTTWHTVGSCSMLPLADGGVVDSRLKVYNTTNIRVVDMSVIPLHIGAHTQATAYALGELGADIIKGNVF